VRLYRRLNSRFSKKLDRKVRFFRKRFKYLKHQQESSKLKVRIFRVGLLQSDEKPRKVRLFGIPLHKNGFRMYVVTTVKNPVFIRYLQNYRLHVSKGETFRDTNG